MKDTSHLVACYERLSHEKARLAEAKTPKERELRTVWVMQAENEIERELAFLGMESYHNSESCELSGDELLAELGVL